MMLAARGSGNVYIGNENYVGTIPGSTLSVGGLSGNLVNGFRMAGTPPGANPVFSAVGNDTDIGLVVAPKGTGALYALNSGNARGTHSTDWQRNRALVTQVASPHLGTIPQSVVVI
jgi:hypothetical protein